MEHPLETYKPSIARLLVANIFSIFCALGSIHMMAGNKEGWGWLLITGLLGIHLIQQKVSSIL